VYINAAEIINYNKNNLADIVSKWIIDNFPYRTTEFDKCHRDLLFVIEAIETCFKNNDLTHIDHLGNLFFNNGVLQLNSTEVEFAAYDFLLQEIEKLLINNNSEAIDFCRQIIQKLKNHLLCRVKPSKILKNRRQVWEYDETVEISNSLIDSLLKDTWEATPSKNNMMPYSLFVLGQDQKKLKEIVYNNCVSRDKFLNEKTKIDGKPRLSPNFSAILSCSHLLIFTLRLEDNPSGYQRRAMANGARFEATKESTLEIGKQVASVEVGMFITSFSALCLEQGIDISYIGCFFRDMEYWKDLPFITRTPLLLVTIGKGKVYRRDINPERFADDLKPNYERIVNFIN